MNLPSIVPITSLLFLICNSPIYTTHITWVGLSENLVKSNPHIIIFLLKWYEMVTIFLPVISYTHDVDNIDICCIKPNMNLEFC